MDEQQLKRDRERIDKIKRAAKAVAKKKKSERFTERRREREHNLYLKRVGGDE